MISNGGRVVINPVIEGYSTTIIIDKLKLSIIPTSDEKILRAFDHSLFLKFLSLLREKGKLIQRSSLQQDLITNLNMTLIGLLMQIHG